MIQTVPKSLSFEQFITWYPDNSEQRYELHDGMVIPMPKPRGKHSDIAGFLIAELNLEIRRSQRSYSIPKECIVKVNENTGYEPDAIVLDRANLANEPLWESRSTISRGETIPLAIEVISTNWRDDYGRKINDYEALGIQEVWLVDYKALGAARFIGDPKLPTVSIYHLVDGEYRVSQFRHVESIVSPTFSQLNLTAEQIFQGF
ncbi:MAG: Uma2 family endonuclease [Spirulina sp.]